MPYALPGAKGFLCLALILPMQALVAEAILAHSCSGLNLPKIYTFSEHWISSEMAALLRLADASKVVVAKKKAAPAWHCN